VAGSDAGSILPTKFWGENAAAGVNGTVPVTNFREKVNMNSKK
jgi:hypothetical protein